MKQALEPTERWRITANPEELDTAERTECTLLLPVPDMLEDGCKGCDTDTSANKDRNLTVEHILGRGTVRTVNSDSGKGVGTVGVKLDKISAVAEYVVIFFLRTLHGCFGHRSDYGRTSTKAFTESMSPVTNLTNMDGDVRVLGGRGDGEGVPLKTRDIRNLDEDPLTRCIFEAGLDDTEFHGTYIDTRLALVVTLKPRQLTTRVNKNLGQPGRPASPNLSVYPLAEVDETGPDDISPTLVAKAVLSRIEWEDGDVVRIDRIAHEAASGVGVEANHEEEGEVVGIPESFEALGTDLVVCGRVHQNHDEEHEVTSDTTCLGIVDIQSLLLTDLCRNQIYQRLS